ncbi:MAG TPA: urease accessory protein UreD [Polyangiaceae bacterium]|jgi:urease accessory protein|nr:urease accessory protein UreD [Polyangiaceae bacterium]
MLAAPQMTTDRGWHARLDLGFAISGRRTALVRRSHSGPLQVQRPFYPDASGGCHVYVLHPPGGLVGGDRLVIDVTADTGAAALLTTPAATKFYRTAGAKAEQRVSIRVARGGVVEWLPQETLVFGGADGESRVDVDVESGGEFLGWEICGFGRPASGDHFATGRFVQRLAVRVGGEPAVMERAEFDGASGVMKRRIALAGFTVTGTFVALTARAELAEQVRQVLPAATATDLFSVTSRRRALVCRYLGDSPERARSGFARAWSVLRTALLGKASHPPRIWAT